MWWRALAWRLLGIKLLPIGPGDVLIVHIDPARVTPREIHALADSLGEDLYRRGVRLHIVTDAVEFTTVLHDRAPAR